MPEETAPEAEPGSPAPDEEKAENPEGSPKDAPVPGPPRPPGPVVGFLLQPGAIESILGLGLLGIGVWAFMKDQYGDKLNLTLLGGFLGIWIVGAAFRWILSLWRKSV